MQIGVKQTRLGEYTQRASGDLPPPSVDVRVLERNLAAQIEGEVRFGTGDRALYANDASVYRQVPIGVLVPKSVEDVVATVAVCRQHGAPIFGRGGGTGLAGQTVNDGVIIDFSKYLNEILELDPENGY